MANKNCAVIVFAKAPNPGAVKTRLIPALGEIKAAKIYRSLMEKTLQTCRSAEFQNIELWCYPDADHPYFNNCWERFNTGLREQQGEDLGERMWFALSRVLSRFRYGIIVGCDCPELSADDLITGAEKLEAGYDTVIGPSVDGGYYLLGSNQDSRDLFTDISWGTASVYSETMERIRKLNLSCYELPEHYDIDRPEDLERWEIGNGK